MNKEKVELGDRVKCLVTGIVGIAICQVSYLYGCKQFGVKQRVNKDGVIPKINWIDEPQLEVLQKGVISPEVKPESLEVKPKYGGNREYPK